MSEFKSVQWSDQGEDIDTTKLSQMASNDDFLNDHLSYTTYQAFGTTKTDGIKILAGVVSIGPSAPARYSKQVSFGNFFTQGCHPVVNATHASGTNWRTFCTVKGIGANNTVPDHTGFVVVLENAPTTASKNNFATVQHVHWIAVGY